MILHKCGKLTNLPALFTCHLSDAASRAAIYPLRVCHLHFRCTGKHEHARDGLARLPRYAPTGSDSLWHSLGMRLRFVQRKTYKLCSRYTHHHHSTSDLKRQRALHRNHVRQTMIPRTHLPGRCCLDHSAGFMTCGRLRLRAFRGQPMAQTA